MSDTIMRGTRPRELPRPNRTYARDRVCITDGCSTRLSTYNKSDYCWVHVPQTFPLVRGERRRKRAA